MNKSIEELEKELQELESLNDSLWKTYGSELCSGEMIEKENILRKEIEKLKNI